MAPESAPSGQGRFIGYVRTTRYDGQGWWALTTVAGAVPAAVRAQALQRESGLLVPFTRDGAEALRELGSARLTPRPHGAWSWSRSGHAPPPARLVSRPRGRRRAAAAGGAVGPAIGAAFERLPGATRNGLALDPWLADRLDAFIARHDVEVAALAADALERMLRGAIAGPRPQSGARELTAPSRSPRSRPCWAASWHRFSGRRSATRSMTRRTFLADEQGLGKTVEALAALEADGAYPAIVVCPASIKLGWEREARRWLPHRSIAVVHGRAPVPPAGGDHDPQLRDRRRPSRGACAPARRGRWWSTSRTTARTRMPSARRRCGGSPRRSPPTACGSR